MKTVFIKSVTFCSMMLAGMVFFAACSRTETSVDEPGHVAEADAGRKGPHNGRLLGDEHFQLEVTIYEHNVPPEYRLYAYADGKPIAPDKVDAHIELQRFGNRRDDFTFTVKDDYLLGSMEVEEPHSFDVTVTVSHAGKSYRWTYESYEGRTNIAAAAAQSAGIETLVAGPGKIHETITLYGSIQPNAERVRAVSARFPGLIRSVTKNLGDAVKAGEALATVESNESLQTYVIAAPQPGVITERHANVGEATSGPLFVITDYTSVWANLSVFPRDRAKLKNGQDVVITATEGGLSVRSHISSIVTSSAPDQNLVARMTLDNADGRWTPGQFVSGTVTVAETPVGIAISASALQSFRDWDVVFLNEGEVYQAMPVQLGRRDGERVEVISGLAAGQRYVSNNSYLVKADIEKSGASHDH